MLFHPDMLSNVAAQQLADRRQEAEIERLIKKIKRENGRLAKTHVAAVVPHLFAGLKWKKRTRLRMRLFS